MPNKTKIIGTIEVKVRELCEKGYNATYIGKEVGLAKDTINSWAKKNGFILARKLSPKMIDLEPKIVEMLKNGFSRKTIQRDLEVHYDQITKIAKQHNLEAMLRDRQSAALDKVLSIEEATKRLPQGDGKVIGFDENEHKYIIQATDGFIYKKSSAKLRQGDPRGKSGYSTEISKLKQELLQIGYEMVENSFLKKRHALKAKHIKCGTIRENRYSNFFVQDCPSCSNNGISKQELSLKEWVESLGFTTSKYKMLDRITRPKEIDIDIEGTSFSIEYCGVCDHGENSRHPRGPKYHFDKMVSEQKRGKKLITIFDYEYLTRNYQIKSFLRATLGKNKNKFFAKNCTVKEIDKVLAKEFFDIYHIQGGGQSQFNVGIYFENQLLGAIAFAKHHRDKNSPHIVLKRLCFKTDNTVVGGTGKMLEFAKDQIKALGYSSIITWSDNRWSSGDVYGEVGFVLEEEMPPDFYYSKGGKLFKKQGLKKTAEEKMAGLTESELRLAEGYDRVWDCGKKRWRLDLI